jgi:hypothetical protein
MGNYNPKFPNSTLEKAKYMFMVARPNEPGFQDDYSQMLANLEKIQRGISSGQDNRNMLDLQTRTTRFAAPLFEERVSYLLLTLILNLTSVCGR